MAETYSLFVAASCRSAASGGGVLSGNTDYAVSGGPASVEVGTTLYLFDSVGGLLDQQATNRNAPFTFSGVADGAYTVEWRETDSNNLLATAGATVQCGTSAPSLVLDSVSATDCTAAGNDGSITAQASGGLDPLTAELVQAGLSQPTRNGQPVSFTSLAAATYTLRVTDSTAPTPQVVEQDVTVHDLPPPQHPVVGCTDEYADNYDATATLDDSSCTYTPRWRSAWQPMAVRVAAVAGQAEAFIVATLRVGFRPSHPLAAARPLGDLLTLCATVGPDGYATFVLGPYLRPQLGAPDGAGGYRLDLNSLTAYSADLYVGYELRRADDTLLEHGYALNAAVPDGQLAISQPGANSLALSAFGQNLPVWPGYTDYLVALTSLDSTGGIKTFGIMASTYADEFGNVLLPCPPNPLPVAWLAPGGGYGFWVFQGRSVLGDSVGDGQRYREASTGEQRFSDPGEAYQTYKASSGVFRGDALLTGLRTLWRSPQAWVQLGGVWVPIVVNDRGSREVGRLGVLRNEVQVSFQLAVPEFAQGQ